VVELLKPKETKPTKANVYRAMENFKNANTRTQKLSVDRDDSSQSDNELTSIVQTGIDQCVEYIKEAASEKQVPFAISFLLSLNTNQL
jgi:hypothetical protein